MISGASGWANTYLIFSHSQDLLGSRNQSFHEVAGVAQIMLEALGHVLHIAFGHHEKSVVGQKLVHAHDVAVREHADRWVHTSRRDGPHLPRPGPPCESEPFKLGHIPEGRNVHGGSVLRHDFLDRLLGHL